MKVTVNRPVGTANALVESPLQLLCAVEAHAAGLLGTKACLLVRDDVPGLDAALAALRLLGLPAGLYVRAVAPRELVIGHSRIHAVGDACSGLFQSLLLTPGRVPQITLYDDGLATLDAVDRLVDPAARLVRPGRTGGRIRGLLGTVAGRTMRRLARANRVMLFTALRLPGETDARLADLGVRVTPNSFAWLRSRPRADAIDEPTVVVGSGLVADGLVDAEAYIGWVARHADGGPVLYIPHRRHRTDVVARIGALPGVRIAEPGAPVEVRLRGLTAPQRVLCLPTTAALLLTPLLAPNGVAVSVHDVPEPWWTSDTDPGLREHLRSVVRLSRAEREPTA